MTTLTIYEQAGRDSPVEATDDPARIAAILASVGAGFERVDTAIPLAPDAEPAAVLAAYAATVEGLKKTRGFQSADVVRLLPTSPNRAEARAKFLAEHTHDDDEVRLFVEGGGTFFLRAGERVVELHALRGDLISVPAGAPHWFDTGAPPFCTAIRLFTRPDGWVARFTGDPIVDRFVSHPTASSRSIPA